MTAHQYGTLKHIISNQVHIQLEARALHMGTIGSLVKRGWLTHNGGLLVLTDEGQAQYELYRQARANFRLHEADISDYVKSLLHVNKLFTMRKVG